MTDRGAAVTTVHRRLGMSKKLMFAYLVLLFQMGSSMLGAPLYVQSCCVTLIVGLVALHFVDYARK